MVTSLIITTLYNIIGADVIDVAEGGSALIGCRVTERSLVGSSTFVSYTIGSSTSTTRISNVTISDEGQYRCTGLPVETFCLVVLSKYSLVCICCVQYLFSGVPVFDQCDNFPEDSPRTGCIDTMTVTRGNNVSLNTGFSYNMSSPCPCPLDITQFRLFNAMVLVDCIPLFTCPIVSNDVMLQNSSAINNYNITLLNVTASNNYTLSFIAFVANLNALEYEKALIISVVGEYLYIFLL